MLCIMNVEKENVKLSAKEKLLSAALKVIREKGYASTTVDDLCSEADVTKGAFFHYFKTKEDLAVSAAEYWSTITTKLFEQASYQKLNDPLDRVLGYIDFRKEIIRGEIPEFTCFVGTMVQETYDSNPKIREACGKTIFLHTSKVTHDIAEAKKKYAPDASWSAESLGNYTQAALQGAFILSKAKNNSDIAIECIEHLRSYVEFLFNQKKIK